MYSRGDQRQEEYGQHLGINALLHFLPAHSHFHQDIKPVLILIAFRDLLVIHDQHGPEEEYRSQEDPQEEEPAEKGNVLCPARSL